MCFQDNDDDNNSDQTITNQLLILKIIKIIRAHSFKM